MSHVTRTPLSRSKGQRPRSPGRFTRRRVGASGNCSGERENVLAVRNCCYVAVCSAARGVSAPTGVGIGAEAYHGGRPPTACMNSICNQSIRVTIVWTKNTMQFSAWQHFISRQNGQMRLHSQQSTMSNCQSSKKCLLIFISCNVSTGLSLKTLTSFLYALMLA